MPHAQPLMLLADSTDSLRDLLRELLVEVLPTILPTSLTSAPESNTLMSIEDVCEEFGISKTTLNDWKKKGLVPFIRIGRRVYFERADVLAAGRSHTKYQHRKG